MSTIQAHISNYTKSIVANGTNQISVTITFTNKGSGNYGNEVYCEFGEKQLYKYIDGGSPRADQIILFDIPRGWVDEIPDSPSGTGKIKLRCVNMDTAKVEYEEVKPFTLYVPEDERPSISSVRFYMVAGAGTWVDYAIYGMTRPLIIASATGSSSPIVKYHIKGGGNETSGEYSSSGETGENFSELGPIVRTFGNTYFTLTLEDARGRTTSIDTEEIYVQPYTRPSIKGLSAYRVDADGITKADGDHIKVTLEAAISPIKDSTETNINTLTCYLQWRVVNGDYGGTLTEIQNNTPHIFEADKEYSYEIRCFVRDKYLETEAFASVVGDNKDFNIVDGGGGAALGMKATKDYFDVAYKSRFQKSLSANGEVSSKEGFVCTGTGSKGDFLSFGEATRICSDVHHVPYYDKDGNEAGTQTVVYYWADFNDFTDIGLYGVYDDYDVSVSNPYHVNNFPCGKAGTMRVFNATGQVSITDTATKQYRMQEYVVYDGSAIYRRGMSKVRDNSDVEWPSEWTFGSWYSYYGDLGLG